MKSSLYEQVSKIRDFINFDSPRKEHLLQQDMTMFIMLCSCMDAIEDTEEALESFLIEDTDNSGTGKNYLRIYGAFQALYVQQKAVENLHEALKIPYTEDLSIEMIRHVRIDAAGHPTNRGNKKAFNFINRGSLSAQTFELMTDSPKETRVPKRGHINIPNLIATQKDVFIGVLNNVIEILREEESEHRKKFADKTLTSVFQVTDHFFPYIYEAATSPNSLHVLGVSGYVDAILKAIDDFKAGLKEREEADDTIAYRYENLDYALQHIKRCFESGKETHINRKDAYIFANFAEQEVDALKEIAKGIDERYSQ